MRPVRVECGRVFSDKRENDLCDINRLNAVQKCLAHFMLDGKKSKARRTHCCLNPQERVVLGGEGNNVRRLQG